MTQFNPVPKKSLGQHWLYEPHFLERMCQVANIQPSDTVLEIGPGLGTLTAYLSRGARRVIAVEYDALLAKKLVGKYANVEVIEADILSFPLNNLPAGYKLVANIPYYLTAQLLRRILTAENRPQDIALLVQKEVAERITAAPGDLSVLGVMCQFYSQTRLDEVVPAVYFDPPPKVDSQIVHLQPSLPTRPIDDKLFFRLVKAGFGERRKKLGNALAGGLRLEKTQVLQLLEASKIDSEQRAQALMVDDWLRLYDMYHMLQLAKNE